MDPNVNSSSVNIQHVTKISSDELLRKFAQVDDEDEDDGFESKREHPARVSRRRKRRRTSRREEGDACESPSHYSGAALVERRSLLAPAVPGKSTFLRLLGIDGAGKSLLRIRNIKNKSVLAAIQKRWHKTMEGASKVLLEKHYSRHRRLINDVV